MEILKACFYEVESHALKFHNAYFCCAHGQKGVDYVHLREGLMLLASLVARRRRGSFWRL